MLRVLHGIGFITDVLYMNGKIINEIRNKFAHNLNPNQDKIKSKIDKMLTPWHPKEVSDSLDRFEKYKTVAINTIIALKNAAEDNENSTFYPEVNIPESENNSIFYFWVAYMNNWARDQVRRRLRNLKYCSFLL